MLFEFSFDESNHDLMYFVKGGLKQLEKSIGLC